MDFYGRGNGTQSRPQRPRGNQPTGFNHMQPQGGFVYAPNLYMPPQMPVPWPLRPFANNFMNPDRAPAMFYGEGQTPSPLMVTPMQPPSYFPPQVPDIKEKILEQIEYYFSDDNLVKDVHLRQMMDDQGWVHGSIIAGFDKISCLTGNFGLILDVMRTSKLVELKDGKMRKRNGWMRFKPIPKSLNVESLFSRSKCNKVEVKGVAMVSGGQGWLK